MTWICWGAASFLGSLLAQEPVTKNDAMKAMRSAVQYYRDKVAVRGGYVYHYSEDLTRRWGEGPAAATQAWVQPPGTPTVGLAYLTAYRATGEPEFLAAAREAGEALAFGRLQSGGWSRSIDLRPRADGQRYEGNEERAVGRSSLDDGQTQTAIRFLAELDHDLNFQHPEIHASTLAALEALLAAQFPIGGFPQSWIKPAEKLPIIAASFPEHDWKTEGRIKSYWDMYTLNDNLAGDVADTLITAHRIYKEEKLLAALRRLGDFLILAQMPEPQPAWAQQYNDQMQPIWARKFEPPAIASFESQNAIETLIKIAAVTGEKKYLEPIPRAIAYLKRSLLPDGRLARYYELRTNRPLYMIRRDKNTYELTYDDQNLPSHYSWKCDAKISQLTKLFEQPASVLHRSPPTAKKLEPKVRTILRNLDDQGRWLDTYQRGDSLPGQAEFTPGEKYLSSATFSHNVVTLSEYVAALSDNARP